MFRFLWISTRGYRLKPWASPYLRWRIETYQGLHAEDLGPREVLRFLWDRKSDLFRFLRWAAAMDSQRRRAAG